MPDPPDGGLGYPGQNESPTWCPPDGRKIAFLGIPGDGPAGSILDERGWLRSSPQLTSDAYQDRNPCRSPDGAQLASPRQRPQPYPPGWLHRELWTMRT